MKRVAIVGGGITGLAAAFVLHRARQEGKPVDYLLIEKEQRVGGKILTEEIDGFVIEGGPDCFVSEKPGVFNLSGMVGIEDRIMGSSDAARRTFVLSGGRLLELPEGLMSLVPTKIIPFALSPLISWPGKFRMAMDLFIPPKKDDSDETLASFVRRRLGQEALDKIAEPLIGGVHASDPEKMSLKATFPRFLQMEKEYGSLIRAMLAAKKKAEAYARKNPPAPGAKKKTFFMTFIKGMGELTEAVYAKLDRERVVLGQAVTELLVREEGGKKVYTLTWGEGQKGDFDAVILALPADEAAVLMAKVDRQIAENLAAIPMASSATISLAWRKEDLPVKLESYGFVIPLVEKRRIMATTFSSCKWAHRTPGEDFVLLRAFVGGARNQHLVELDDKELLQLVREELADILGVTKEPYLYRIYRWPRGMPQYVLGHLERLARVEERLRDFPGLYIVGGSYRGVGIPDCINAGMTAAEKALT